LTSGHTKFGPDGNFGTIKSNIKRTNLYSIQGLRGSNGLIQTSASDNVEVLYRDPQTGNKAFRFHDWKRFFGKKFLPCTGIRDWHVIKILPEGPNIFVANFINEPFTSVRIMNESIDLEDYIDMIEPEGLTEARLKELEFFKDYLPIEEKENIITKNV